jgi:hypothetical protein
MKAHPTLNTILELADIFSLTLDVAHRLFGCDLESIREYDVWLNGGRTRIKLTHQRGCPGKVHRSLGTCDTSEAEPDKGGAYRAGRAKQFSLSEGLPQSLV